ncbi:hypothetical protein GGI14_002081, partial [Coemansia sp. S680]
QAGSRISIAQKAQQNLSSLLGSRPKGASNYLQALASSSAGVVDVNTPQALPGTADYVPGTRFARQQAAEESVRDHILQNAHLMYSSNARSPVLIEMLLCLHQLHPRHLPTLLLLACAYFSSGQADKSLEYNELILKIDPNYVEAMSNIGTTLRSMGKAAEAENWWWQAVKLRPGYWDAVENLMGVLCNPSTGGSKDAGGGSGPRYREALQLCEFVDNSLRMGDEVSRGGTGAVGKYQVQEKQLSRLQSLLYSEGNLRLALGDVAGARREYEKALEAVLGGYRLDEVIVRIASVGAHEGINQMFHQQLHHQPPPSHNLSIDSLPLTLLAPENAVRILQTLFPDTRGVLPGFVGLSSSKASSSGSSTSALQQANHVASNLVLQLAKLHQDHAVVAQPLSIVLPLYYIPNFVEAVCGLANAMAGVCDWRARDGLKSEMAVRWQATALASDEMAEQIFLVMSRGKRPTAPEYALKLRKMINYNGSPKESPKNGALVVVADKRRGWMDRVVEIADQQLSDGRKWGNGLLVTGDPPVPTAALTHFVDRLCQLLPLGSTPPGPLSSFVHAAQRAVADASSEEWRRLARQLRCEGGWALRLAERVMAEVQRRQAERLRLQNMKPREMQEVKRGCDYLAFDSWDFGELDPEEDCGDWVYTERMIYMPHTYFVNDHRQGFREDEDVRVAASVVCATGHGRDMVVGSAEEYIERAVEWAQSASHRYEGEEGPGRVRVGCGPAADLRRRLFLARDQSRLFDTERWTRNLERGLEEAWRRWTTGEDDAPMAGIDDDEGGSNVDDGGSGDEEQRKLKWAERIERRLLANKSSSRPAVYAPPGRSIWVCDEDDGMPAHSWLRQMGTW